MTWAQKRVDALSALADRHRDELHALGRRFGIVTPGTSLIVLETLDQHIQHAVEPPASRPALLAEYRRVAADRDAVTGRRRADKIESVVEMWEERVAWWERRFTYDPASLKKKIADAAALRAPPRRPRPPRLRPRHRWRRTRRSRYLRLPSLRSSPSVPLLRAMEQVVVQGESSATAPVITVKPWSPDAPYLRAIERAGKASAYAAYLRERETWGTSPAFFLDCADHLLRAGQRELARPRDDDRGGAAARGAAPPARRPHTRLPQQASELDVAISPLRQGAPAAAGGAAVPLRDLALAGAARADARRARRGAGGERPRPRSTSRPIELLQPDRGRRAGDGRFPNVEVLALLEIQPPALALLDRGNALPAAGHPGRSPAP